jgi:hypothetical protein
MRHVSNNLWGNPNREITNASDVTRRRAGYTVYNNVKQNTNHVIENGLSRKKNNHTYGIGYSGDGDRTDDSAAILTSRSYQDKYMISKGRFCCISNNNIDYLKNEANNGNKLVVKYKEYQILYTGNIYSENKGRAEDHDMIQDPSVDGEGYIVKINHEDWIKKLADLSYNKSNSSIHQSNLNPLNNKNFTIKGPIEL